MNVKNDLTCFSAQELRAKRILAETEDSFRKCFSIDRDRILYSKGFRRLSGKTQVFVVGYDDHCRTRLTHTLEVSQIATTISKNLGLNVELTEAIALGHDVGHTPFGHVGERFLNLLMNGCYDVYNLKEPLPLGEEEKGFKHNLQSLKVVTSLEKHSTNNPNAGLNLTNYTLWGLVKHTKDYYDNCPFSLKEKNDEVDNKYTCGYMHKNQDCRLNGELSLGFYNQYKNKMSDIEDWTYESFVVAMADEIAQRHHDIEDGIEANILKKDSLILKLKELIDELNDEDKLTIDEQNMLNEIENEKNKLFYLPLFSSFIVGLLTKRLIYNAQNKLNELKKENNIKKECDFHKIKKTLNWSIEKKRIDYSKSFSNFENKLHGYLYKMIINSYLAQKMDGKSDFILRQLTKAYVTNPQQLPDRTILTLINNFKEKICNSFEKDKLIDRIKSMNIIQDETSVYEYFIKPATDVGFERIILNNLHKSNLDIFKITLLRTICDYISGMTDNFAFSQYEDLYESRSYK